MKQCKLSLIVAAAAVLFGTSAATVCAEEASLSLAYQYGLAYAPAVIAEQKGFIEEAYNEAENGTLTVTWNQMSSGADINVGIASGELDGGFMGLAPAVTGITKGVGYRVFTNLSGQSHGLMSNDPSVASLADLVGSSHQIALVNIGSIQHILLAKALYENGYDPHALDSNIVAMAHPDGMTALESGSVACHLTSSPYIFLERDDDSFTELPEVSETWSEQDSFIVGVANEALKEENPAVYEALCEGIRRGMEFMEEYPDEAAELLSAFDGRTPEEEKELLAKGTYSEETSGLFEIASFMAESGFIDNAPASYEDLVFDNVKGD